MNIEPNSRIITIFRRNTFAMDAQVATAAEFIAMSKRSIGSYWTSSYSKAHGSGLTHKEQELLMPQIVDVEPTDRNFRKAVSEYFASIKTAVPYDKGRQLEIGLSTSNTEPVSADNMPLNLFDYIAYRHALGHPQVAPSKAAAQGNPLKEFYIFDPVAEEAANSKTESVKDQAMELYLKLKKQPKKMDMLLTLLGVDPRTIKGANRENLKAERLKKIAETQPEKFTTTYDNKHFEETYIIQSLVNTGVLRRVGERIIEPSTGETLGHKMDEAVAWLKDKANSDKVILLRARMQDALGEAAAEVATEKAK